MGSPKQRSNTDLPLSIDERITTTMDAGDIWIKRSAYEKTDLLVASTEKIVDEYISDGGDVKYKEYELSLNAAGEVVKLEILGYTTVVPSWASTLLP